MCACVNTGEQSVCTEDCGSRRRVFTKSRRMTGRAQHRRGHASHRAPCPAPSIRVRRGCRDHRPASVEAQVGGREWEEALGWKGAQRTVLAVTWRWEPLTPLGPCLPFLTTEVPSPRRMALTCTAHWASGNASAWRPGLDTGTGQLPPASELLRGVSRQAVRTRSRPASQLRRDLCPRPACIRHGPQPTPALRPGPW